MCLCWQAISLGETTSKCPFNECSNRKLIQAIHDIEVAFPLENAPALPTELVPRLLALTGHQKRIRNVNRLRRHGMGRVLRDARLDGLAP